MPRAAPERSAAARLYESGGIPYQQRPRRHRRRSGAGRGAEAGNHCRSGARRVRARARGDTRPFDDGERRAAPTSGQRHARDTDRHGPPGARQPQGVFRRRAAARPGGVSDEELARTAGLLHDCFRDVIRTHQPEIERVLAGERLDPLAPPELVARAIQAQGMWFQLLSIAEQNAAMRHRRQSEVARGYDQLRGTFAQVVSAAARGAVAADEMRAVVANLRVRPVITAHPTEAKRVTVLEKHRRIYRRLVDLEAPRWTPRERGTLVENLRTEIELLWLTGELRLEKPTVEQELAWGLYFVHENLFEVVPELVDKLERALRQAYPTEHWQVAPFFQFGSWIGGDRDGNPFVTNDVTRRALFENRIAVRRRRADPAAQPGRGVSAVRDVHAAQARRHAHLRGTARDRARDGGVSDGRRADRRLAHARGRARRSAGGARRRSPRPPGTPRSGSVPVLDLPARRPRQLAAGQRRARGAVAGPELGRPALAGVTRVAHLAAARAGSPAPPPRGAAGPAPRGARDHRPVPADSRGARVPRPRSGGHLHPEHDARRGGHPRRVPARQRGGSVCRRRRGRELYAPDRAAVRVHRRPAAGARNRARPAAGAAGAPHRACPGRRVRSDDRILRLEQGRRLPRIQLGARQGSATAHPARPGVRRADRLFPRPRRLSQRSEE